ncbi:unnamed protein product [Schistosoma intercalatum]|nr:unnamed protein product [Schistosoma intercalatum]
MFIDNRQSKNKSVIMCDKPYSCSACGVTFTQGSSLKLHIRSRHNDNIKYFSLIRKPGKNNLTKLWTRILKKDLPKFNTFKSSSPSSSSFPSSSSYYYHYYYYYNYWNKWKNIKLNNQIKNQYKNQLNSNSNFIDSIFNNMKNNNNNSLLINDKNIKKIIQSNNWKSTNFNLKMNMNKKFDHHHHHHKKYMNYIQSINNNDLKFTDQIIHLNHDPDQYDIDQIKLNEQLIKQENI